MTIGNDTETQARRSIQDASDQAEARWNYAFWIQNELTVVGNLTGDPDGATTRQEWIRGLGLWYDEPAALADWDSVIGPLAAQIKARFSHTCCQFARTLHTTSVIERSVSRTVPVIVHELEYYEAIARQTEAANPPGLADEFTSWVRNGCCIRTVPIPDSTVTRAADLGRGRLDHRNGTGREAAGRTGPMRWNLRLTAANKGIWKASELQRSLERLRVDRQLEGALTHGPDPLHLAEVFGLDEKTAMRYADSARRLLETSAESLSAVTASVDDQC